MLSSVVGKQVGKQDWIGVPFAGGMSEVPELKARGILVNDLHRDIINLARCARHEAARKWLAASAEELIFHPDELAAAQQFCLTAPAPAASCPFDAERALQYFVTIWMGRSSKPGTKDEFKGGLAVRFTASGGGSNVRYRSAIESLEAFGQVLKDCEFSTLDFRQFLTDSHDRRGHALYSDAPWPGDGKQYRHPFTEQDQRDLAKELQRFKLTRVVVRFGDHPLIRELYPEDRWNWVMLESRTQANKSKAEALIINGESFA